MTALHEEPLTDLTLDEVISFVRGGNPFLQQVWGWDMGRLIDWRWGSNTLRAAEDPDWFGKACRVFRVEDQIRAVAIAEYGTEAECILTEAAATGVVAEILDLLVERHRQRGIGIDLEFAGQAQWLRDVCREAGLFERQETSCEWEYDLGTVDTSVVLPDGFEISSLKKRPDADRGVMAECIKLAFGATRDLEDMLRTVETSPAFLPELSVFALSPDGVIAAYCRGTVDPANGVCGIDPICTHPGFQQLGLGKAVVRTLFSTQLQLGGRYSYVGSAPPPAPGTFLYRSLGPSDVAVGCTWSNAPE